MRHQAEVGALKKGLDAANAKLNEERQRYYNLQMRTKRRITKLEKDLAQQKQQGQFREAYTKQLLGLAQR